MKKLLYATMKYLIATYFLLLSNVILFGQNDSSTMFESSKGKWSLPLPKYPDVHNMKAKTTQGISPCLYEAAV